jgi:hypothetical protein
MSNFFLNQSEQGIVIFHIWKSLPYKMRILLSFTLILSGFIIQYQMLNFFPGVILVFVGNLFLLVKGYDNRIKLASYKSDSEWANTSEEQLQRIVEMNKKNQKWDISAIDITSGLGVFVFLIILVAIIVICINNPFNSNAGILILISNIVLLILPHWFTGVKRITTVPAMVNKIKLYQELMQNFQKELEQDQIVYLMLVQGKDQKLPADLKMKIKFQNQTEDFLGLYAQISMNNVKGQDYPYFYVVLVAKQAAGLLGKIQQQIEMPTNVIKEYKLENDVEILVIRQYTTKDSGYYTDPDITGTIFKTGISASRMILKV